MNTITPFGQLPTVPFASLHNPSNSPPQNSYAFVLANDTLSIQKIENSPLQGEVDLAKITRFVRDHLDNLPEESRHLIPKQINFLVEKHNKKAGEEIPLIKKIQTPNSGGDLVYSAFLQDLEAFFETNQINEATRSAFVQKLEANLTQSEQVRGAIYTTIRQLTTLDGTLTTEQGLALIERVALLPSEPDVSPGLNILPIELPRRISTFVPNGQSLQTIYMDIDRILETTFSPMRRTISPVTGPIYRATRENVLIPTFQAISTGLSIASSPIRPISDWMWRTLPPTVCYTVGAIASLPIYAFYTGVSLTIDPLLYLGDKIGLLPSPWRREE